MQTRGVKLMLTVLIMKSCMGKECEPIPLTWKVSPIPYQGGGVSITWETGSDFCTDRILISQATESEETISPPVKVSQGQAIVQVIERCKLYTFRMAALLPGRNEVNIIF